MAITNSITQFASNSHQNQHKQLLKAVHNDIIRLGKCFELDRMHGECELGGEGDYLYQTLEYIDDSVGYNLMRIATFCSKEACLEMIEEYKQSRPVDWKILGLTVEKLLATNPLHA